MSRATIAAGGFAVLLAVLLAVAAGRWLWEQDFDPRPSPALSAAAAEEAAAEPEAAPGFLYGRVTTEDGATFEGRLRWGGDEEAFWSDYFNGVKDENPWAAHVPPEQAPKERDAIEIFGLELFARERPADLGRPFMARFGDIARIEARGSEVRVTLKSGTVFRLDRLNASDFDDDVRVWDARSGVVDLASGIEDVNRRRIVAVELLPTAPLAGAPDRLHGTVRTRQGDFTGFVQWDREECVGSDELDGHTADGALALRFDTIRSIERRSVESAVVTLRDGREILLSGTDDVGRGHRGIYVDDPRYGRVLIRWNAFERVDFSPGDSGPAYADFPPGHPLTGRVATRGGRRLAGRLVYDLDESETTETLDAPADGVDYTIPFGLIASIALPGPGEGDAGAARVTLHGGEELRLARSGDLADANAGLLVFADGAGSPEYVPWSEVAEVELDPPPATYPPLGAR